MIDRARTIFLGTGGFAVPVVDALANNPLIELLAVVTAPRRDGANAKRNEPPVASWAAEHGVPTFRPHRLRSPASVEHMREHKPDLLVLADYGQIVPPDLLDLAPHGALNLHPSLLPRHRGATPIPAAILAGDAETGVTLMRMDAGLDSGPIVAQSRVALTGDETASELEAKLADEAAHLLDEKLSDWLGGRIEPQPQGDGVTFTRPLRRANGRIDPSRSAAQLARQVRAYQPWPGSFFEAGGERIVVWRAHPLGQSAPTPEIGVLVRSDDGGIALATSDGLLALDEVQPAGGKRMSSAELVRGRPALIGARVTASAEAGS